MITIRKEADGTHLTARPDGWSEELGAIEFTARFVADREPFGNELNAVECLLEMLTSLRMEAERRRTRLAALQAADEMMDKYAEQLSLNLDLGNVDEATVNEWREELASIVARYRL